MTVDTSVQSSTVGKSDKKVPVGNDLFNLAPVNIEILVGIIRVEYEDSAFKGFYFAHKHVPAPAPDGVVLGLRKAGQGKQEQQDEK